MLERTLVGISLPLNGGRCLIKFAWSLRGKQVVPQLKNIDGTKIPFGIIAAIGISVTAHKQQWMR